MTSFLGNALIGAGFDLPQFNASAKAMVQSALDHGKEAGKKFADGFKTSQNGQDMLDRQQFTNAIKKGMEESAQVALLGGKRVAENFVQGLEAIHSGNPEAVFSSVTRAMDNAIHVSGAAADGLVKVAGKFESLGPAAAVAGKSVEIATEAMKIFNEAGGETLSLLAQIGDSYLEASRKLAASTTNMEQLPSQLDAVREIMASGAIVHFDDVTDSLGRFQRALPLAGEQLTEFTKTYASMSELIGATSPTNIAGMLNAFTPSDAAKAKLYDYSDELTKFTNIVRATGGQTQTMVDQRWLCRQNQWSANRRSIPGGSTCQHRLFCRISPHLAGWRHGRNSAAQVAASGTSAGQSQSRRHPVGAAGAGRQNRWRCARQTCR